MIAYDPLDPTVLDNPYALYDEMRREAPVLWHAQSSSWMLTKYRDCTAVLRDNSTFARDWRRVGDAVDPSTLNIQNIDPPQQTPLRSLFTTTLKSQPLERIAEIAEATLRESFELLLNAMEPVDLLEEIAIPLSLSVISLTLGIPAPRIQSFRSTSDAIMRSMDAGLNPELADLGAQARVDLTAMVSEWARSNQPGFVTDVARRRWEGNEPPIPETQLQNSTRVMFQGGYSTMVAATGNVILAVANAPHVLDGCESPEATLRVVNELLRYDGPVQGTARVALVDTKLSGTAIKAGDVVTTLFGAANRDPEMFAEPNSIMIDRNPNHHLAFGWGPHSCLGSILAEASLGALLNALRAADAKVQLCGRAPRRATATMRTPSAIPASIVSSRR